MTFNGNSECIKQLAGAVMGQREHQDQGGVVVADGQEERAQAGEAGAARVQIS